MGPKVLVHRDLVVTKEAWFRPGRSRDIPLPRACTYLQQPKWVKYRICYKVLFHGISHLISDHLGNPPLISHESRYTHPKLFPLADMHPTSLNNRKLTDKVLTNPGLRNQRAVKWRNHDGVRVKVSNNIYLPDLGGITGFPENFENWWKKNPHVSGFDFALKRQ
jgi:hypothetical protein